MEQGGATATAPTAFPSAKRKRVAEDCQDLRKDVGLDSDLPVAPSTSTSSATSTSSTSFSTSTSSSPYGSFESVVQDEARYRAHRHAPLPAAVARTLEDKAGWGRDVSAQRQRCAEDAVQRKQAELDRTNHLYKALARKSFQLSVTLLLHPAPTQQREEEVGIPTNSQLPAPSPATTPASSSPSPTSGGVGMPPVDIHRTIVLPAAMPLAKLHKTLQTMMGWEDSQKYMFMTGDGVPIAKYSKDEIPCLSDSKIRLAYIVKDSGDEFYYQYGEWIHRLIVETVGAPRRNIPSTRVISGAGQCPPDDSTPSRYVGSGMLPDGERRPFSVDAVNAQLMAGQTFYMRIPASASKEHEEFVCLRAMRTPVNILCTPTNLDSAPIVAASSVSSSSSSSSSPSTEGAYFKSETASHSPRNSSPHSAPMSAGLPSTTPSPPTRKEQLSDAQHRHRHHHQQQSSQIAWDPAALMSLPSSSGSLPASSGSLPGHYYPSSLQHHDLATWRDEAVEQQHRHLSSPSFFSSSSSSSSSSNGSWLPSPYGIPPRSTGVPSLPPSSSFSSSYPPSEGDEGDDLYYTRDRYPPPSHYHHHHQQQQPSQAPHQASYYGSSRMSSALPSDSSAAGGGAAPSSSLSHPPSHLLPFPSHTLPPFPSYLSSSAPANSPMSMRSRSPSPLFPPPSSLGGFYPPLPPSSMTHDLMLGGPERLPPLSGTAGLFSPDSSPPLPPFSSSSSSSSSTSSLSPSSSANGALPPFPMSISPPSSASSFSPRALETLTSSASPSYYHQHNHHHQQQHYSSNYSSPRSNGDGGQHHQGSSPSFVVPSPTFPPSFLLRGANRAVDESDPASASADDSLATPAPVGELAITTNHSGHQL